MNSLLIKPYNEILKTVELYNKLVKLYYEQREVRKAEYEALIKHRLKPATAFSQPTIINELLCDIDNKDGEIKLSFFADGKRHLLFHANVAHMNAYRNLGIIVDSHLANIMEIADDHNIDFRAVQKDYDVLIKKRYENLCQLAEKITKERIEEGVVGHLSVFHEPLSFCDDPIKLAEYEDEATNARAFCRPRDGVEYYSAMQYFLTQTDIGFCVSW